MPFLIVGLIVVLVFAVGCTDDNAVADMPLPPSDAVLPGQALVVTGVVTGDGIAGGTIDTITFTVMLAPGQKPVDMEKIAIFYADTIRTETLTPVEGFRGEPGQGQWAVINVKNQIGSMNNRLEDREQFVIRINPKAYLPAKRMITVVVRAPSDVNPLTFRRTAPDTILKENNILTPL